MVRKSHEVKTRLNRQGFSSNPSLVEFFLPTRYFKNYGTNVAFLNSLLAGTNEQLFSDSVKSARRDLKKNRTVVYRLVKIRSMLLFLLL